MVAVATLTLPLLCPIYNTFPNFLPSFRGYHARGYDSQPIPTVRIWDRGRATCHREQTLPQTILTASCTSSRKEPGVQTLLDLHSETTSIQFTVVPLHSSSVRLFLCGIPFANMLMQPKSSFSKTKS